MRLMVGFLELKEPAVDIMDGRGLERCAVWERLEVFGDDEDGDLGGRDV